MNYSLKDIYLFRWGDLNFEDLDTYIGLDALKEIGNNLEESLEKNRKNFNEKVSEMMAEVPDEYKDSYYQHYFAMDEWILDQIEIRQRYSGVLSIFSFFEERMKSISEYVEKEFEFRIRISDLSSADMIMKYWNYLIKVYEIDIRRIEPYFTHIKRQKVVRNIIAHQGGNAKQNQIKKIQFAPGMKLENNSVVIDSNAYLLYLAKYMNSFFKETYRAIDGRYKILKGI